jgi:hypothetical protein
MLGFLQLLGTFVANLFRSRRWLEVENLFLRHQLNIALRGAPQEQAIPVREVDTTAQLPPQHDQLTSERRVLCLKSALRLEQRGEQGQEEAEQRDHRR